MNEKAPEQSLPKAWILALTVVLLGGAYALFPRAEPLDPATASAAALYEAAETTLDNGDLQEAQPLVEAALKKAVAARNRTQILDTLNLNARLAEASGETAKAETILSRGVMLAEASRDDSLIGSAKEHLARFYISRKAWDKAMKNYSGAYGALLGAGEGGGAGNLALAFADTLAQQNSSNPAARKAITTLYTESITAFRVGKSDFNRATVHERLGDFISSTDPLAAHEQYFQAALLFKSLRRADRVTQVDAKAAALPVQIDRH